MPDVDTDAAAVANGAALAAAIAAANASATRRAVLVRAGATYSFLPAVAGFDGLRGVTLQLEGALNASTANFTSRWPGFPSAPWAPLSFSRCDSLSIVGRGVLNGRGNAWWWYTILVADHRSNLLTVSSCTNLSISGVTLLNAPQYNFALWDVPGARIDGVTVLVDIEDQLDALRYIGGGPPRAAAVSARADVAAVLRAARLIGPADAAQVAAAAAAPRLDDAADAALRAARRAALPAAIRAEPWFDARWSTTPPIPMVWALNTDGIDFTGANVTVVNSTVTNFDDAICAKPLGAGACTSALIDGAHITYGVGVSMGSVRPLDGGDCIDGVRARNLVFDTPLKAIYVKPNPPADANATGTIANVRYEDVVIRDALWWPIFIGPQQQHQPSGGSNTGCPFIWPLLNSSCPTDPEVTVANVTLSRVRIERGLFSPGVVLANESNPFTGIAFDDVVAVNASRWPADGYIVRNALGNATGGTTPVPAFGAGPGG